MSGIFEKLIGGLRNTLKEYYDKDRIDVICGNMIKDINDPEFLSNPASKAYIPDSIRNIWSELSKETKLAVYIMTCISLARDLESNVEEPINLGSKGSVQIH